MSAENAIRRTVAKLERTSDARTPVPPIALVRGPKLALSAGDPDQPFWTASIDKVFIATLIAQLIDAGMFSPETPIGRLLPHAELGALPAAQGVAIGRDVTVEQLLSHTSGLPDVIIPPRGYTTECSIKELPEDPSRIWTLAEFLAQAVHLPPFAKPGERFRYSDTGYFLLIRIIEEASGTGFGDRLRRRIFDPCEMHTSAQWVEADADRLAALVPELAPFSLGGPGHDDRAAFAPNLTWSNGMGGPSTANELVRFQRALHGGELCDPQWISFMGTPRSRFRPGIHYGAGMVALRFAGFFPLMRGYPEPVGGLGYTSTHMFYYPAQRTHVILNYHAHRRMNTSFQMHIRLAGLIKRFG